MLAEVTKLIKHYELSPHSEGGWYRRTYCAKDVVQVQGEAASRYHHETRPAASAIIYLLEENHYSAWHTVQSDETWHFYRGAPLLLRVIDPNTKALKEILLSQDDQLQYTVPAQHLFCAETLGNYSLMGCMVAPAFTFDDFKLINKEEFLKDYSEHQCLVKFASI